jgi:hypothetical protein
MSGTEIFGFIAVLVMVTSYAREHRSPTYILIFAAACLAAAIYAALIHSWPFASVEALWSVIAFRRWLHRRPPDRVAPTER